MISAQRTIVTGGAGFIGSHLVERLLNEGHQVIVLDNLATGRKENLEPFLDSSQLQFFQVDIAKDELSSFFQEANWVFHLAALADIVPSINNPLEYHRANVDGTVAVLEASRKAGVERFIYTASSSCYGIPEVYPTPESSLIDPRYPYALTKYLGEEYALHWARVYGLPVVSLRLFNVYGPRARTSGTYGAVFGVFLAQKLAGVPFTVVGDGRQTRDFSFVSDVVDAFYSAASSSVTGEVFNVGSGGSYSINSLVELLGGEVEYIPKRPGEPDATFADISKIAKVLHWKPKVPFQEGVEIMLENIEAWKDAPVWNEQTISQATKEWFAYLK